MGSCRFYLSSTAAKAAASPPQACVLSPWQWLSSCAHASPQVKCYHKKHHTATRDTIFRLQFHTGAVQGYRLLFAKEELDGACTGEEALPASWAPPLDDARLGDTHAGIPQGKMTQTHGPYWAPGRAGPADAPLLWLCHCPRC